MVQGGRALQFIVTSLQDGGPYMYIIALADAILLVFAAVFTIGKHRGRCVAAMLAALLPLALGVSAYYSGLAQLNSSLEFAAPERREMLMAASRELLLIPLKFGSYSSVFLVLLTGIKALLGWRKTL